MDNGASAESSLRDDLAKGLAEIEARQETPAATPEGEQAPAPQADAEPQSAEAQSDRGDGRDAHGRFVKKGEEGSTEPSEQAQTEARKPADSQQANAADSKTTDQAANPESADADAPPKSWRADEASTWKDLPAPARAAILRREADNARLAGANDAERMFGREMADIFRPHLQEIQASGANPQLALKALLANHNDLRNPEKRLGTARNLLMQYGIDPAQLAQPDPNAPSDPFVAQLQGEIAQLKARLGQPQGQQFAPLPPSADENNIMAEIEAFRADPAHPHFDAVHAHMGRLLETGAAPDLESAYQAAVAMTPALRSTVPAAPPPAANLTKDAATARRASASVTGSPGKTGSPTPMSLRDELAEGLRSAGFSV